MADLDQAVLENPADQQFAAQELRRQQFATLKTEKLPTAKATAEEQTFGRPGFVKSAERAARLTALRRARSKMTHLSSTTAADELRAEASSVALQAYTFLWQRAHELIEGLAFYFFMIGAFLAAPLADALFGIRVLVGKAMKGGFNVTFNGISVPAVPDISPVEFAYRGAKLLFINLIAAIEWIVIIIIIKLVTDPTFVANLGLQALFGSPPATPTPPQ